MAQSDVSRPYGDLRPASRRPGFLGRVAGFVIAWNDARVTRDALHKLSDHELCDIGLSRSDIERVARSRS